MKLFVQHEGKYVFEVCTVQGTPGLWPARLGLIANLNHDIEENALSPVNADLEDKLVIVSAETLMRFIHVFGHVGGRFLFTGLLEGAGTQMGVRFFDQEHMIEIHVWPMKAPILIVIYHFSTNMEYRISVVPNFR